MKNITLAVATYNRKDILKIFASQLDEKIKGVMNIRIYDDKSTEYNEEYLKKIFGGVESITVRKENMKADKNMAKMYEDFLQTRDQYLVQVDSDMIFGDKFIEMVIEICKNLEKEQESIYSLYNSNNHEFIKEGKNCIINREKFMEKNHIGGACVIFPRSIVEKIIKDIKIENEDYSSYDWRWSKYLRKKNISLYVSENSYLQHIGLGGQNNKNISDIDFGKNFVGVSGEKESFLLNYYEKLILFQNEYLKDIPLSYFIKIKLKKIRIFQIIKRYI